MARAWIEDEWFTPDKQQTAKHGAGSRWRAYWWEDTAPDATGRTKRRRSKRFQRKPDAQQFVAKIENDLRAGTYRPPENAATLFATIAAEWLQTRHDIKPATYRRYDRELRSYVLPQWESRKVGGITKAQIAQWVAELAAGTAPARYKIRGSSPPAHLTAEGMHGPLAPASIGHLHTVLSAALQWAVETDRISHNPATGVRLPRVTQAEHVYLNHEDIDALATAAHGVTDDETDRALVLFLAYTGLRINEALALTVGALNLMTARAEVRQTWTVDREGKRVLGTPKTHERRAVPLPRFLVDQLMTLTAGTAPADYVFRAARGGPMSDQNWRTRVFNIAAKDADLDTLGITPHKLRHTAASAAIAAGADVKVVQQMLGHKDATETLNTYGHLWPDRLDEISAALEAARTEALRDKATVLNVPKMSPRAV